MKILVCVKQICETGEMNRFDMFALEEALTLKERLVSQQSTPVTVDVVTVGQEEASKIIRRAFGMGADHGYHIVTPDSGYVCSFVTASKLAAVAKRGIYDLIFTGIMSEDAMDGQTGPMLAEIMGVPCATGVVKMDLPTRNNTLPVQREMENGFRHCLEICLPAVVTLQAGINTPRYPSLSNMLAAAKKQITRLAESEGEATSVSARTIFVSLEDPENSRAGTLLMGSATDTAAALLSIIKERGLL